MSTTNAKGIRLIRFVVIAFFTLVTGFAIPRAAEAAVTTNYSDVWWNPNESGWGVNISQQSDFLFVSLFVYGPDNQPFWYTAQLTYAGQAPNGDLIFSGDTYATTGPWFGSVFNASQVGIRRVGAATFTATSTISGVLQYTVDGITVTKSLVRQTLKTESLAGSYLGGTETVQTCTNPALDGTFLNGAGITIEQAGQNFQFVMEDVGTGNSCTYAGPYIQDGQIGRAAGQYSCTSSESGSFSLVEIQSSVSGIMGRLNASATFGSVSCTFTGRFAAVRRSF